MAFKGSKSFKLNQEEEKTSGNAVTETPQPDLFAGAGAPNSISKFVAEAAAETIILPTGHQETRLAPEKYPTLDHTFSAIQWKVVAPDGSGWISMPFDHGMTFREMVGQNWVGWVKDTKVFYITDDSMMDGPFNDGQKEVRSALDLFARLVGRRLTEKDLNVPLWKLVAPEGELAGKKFYKKAVDGAISAVARIESEAKKFGWKENELYSRASNMKFPYGDDWGLISYLEHGDRIGRIDGEGIEIINTAGNSLVYRKTARKGLPKVSDGVPQGTTGQLVG